MEFNFLERVDGVPISHPYIPGHLNSEHVRIEFVAQRLAGTVPNINLQRQYLYFCTSTSKAKLFTSACFYLIYICRFVLELAPTSNAIGRSPTGFTAGLPPELVKQASVFILLY